MGVLAGLTDLDILTTRVRTISSVSGGGYAALFLYSKLMVSEAAYGKYEDPKALFEDCIPSVYSMVFVDGTGDRIVCPPYGNSKDKPDQPVSPGLRPFVYQHFVRCRQDVLENDCHLEHADESFRGQPGTSPDHPHWATAVGVIAGTLVSAIGPNFIARTLFDWPVNLSPSREAYLRGIGTAYALYPRDVQALRYSRNLAETCGLFLNCRQWSDLNNSGRINRDGLTFRALREFADRNPDIPGWIINATASHSRSIFGWAREGRRDFSRYTLQISSHGARSGLYGGITAYHQDLPQEPEDGPRRDILDAVTTSAAFFDANQTALEPRLLVALGLHASALDWGIDIPNDRVTAERRALHKTLPLWPWPWRSLRVLPSLRYPPVPTYFIDGAAAQLVGRPDYQASGYIRLLDGGNNDNLGAYTLVELGVRHLIISDHSLDRNGEMADLCMLQNEVGLREPGGTRKLLLVPGLTQFEEHCRRFAAQSAGADASEPPEFRSSPTAPVRQGSPAPNVGYRIDKWPFRVLLGCIVVPRQDKSHSNCRGDIETYVYVLKPAFHRVAFSEQFIDETTGKVMRKACEGKDRWACEVAAYLKFFDRPNVTENKPFPQHGTVGMTYASNALRYGAYRDLARWQMDGLRSLLSGGHEAFREAIERQVNCLSRTDESPARECIDAGMR